MSMHAKARHSGPSKRGGCFHMLRAATTEIAVLGRSLSCCPVVRAVSRFLGMAYSLFKCFALMTKGSEWAGSPSESLCKPPYIVIARYVKAAMKSKSRKVHGSR